jgi:O-antigen/teichoic acid export membrane protein
MQKKITSRITSFFWAFTERAGVYFLELILTIFLSRLLEPREFGLIAMLTIFIAIASIITEGGLNSALIRKNDSSQIEYSTVFYNNLIVSFLLYIILFLFSPIIARFYNQPELENILKIISLTLPINILSSIHQTILIKKLNFKKVSIIKIIASLFGVSIGIFLAYNNFSYWSIVAKQLITSSVIVIIYWSSNIWYPSFTFSREALKEAYSYSSKILLSRVITIFFDNIYSLIIGKIYNPVVLGLYSRANTVKEIPSNTIIQVTTKVTFSLLAQVKDKEELLIKEYRKLQISVSDVNFIIMAIFAGFAPSIVFLLLSEKWMSIVPMIRIFCFIGLFQPISQLQLNLMAIKGHTKEYLICDTLKKVSIVVALIITIPFDIEIMLLGQTVVSVINYFINTYFFTKSINYTILEQWKDSYKSFILSILVFVIAILLEYVFHYSIYYFYPLKAIVISLFILIVGYLFKIESILYLKRYFQK